MQKLRELVSIHAKIMGRKHDIATVLIALEDEVIKTLLIDLNLCLSSSFKYE